LAFLVKGVLGGFDGQYHRMLFHENSRDYELLEDRDLWLLELRLGPLAGVRTGPVTPSG
jgi:hypothetical protein